MAGDSLSGISYVVYNNSSEPWTGRVYVTVRLSSNDNISESDVLIDTHNFTYSFEPKSWATVDVSTPPVIPISTARGTHWLGVILDFADHDSSNNDSDGQAAVPIVVGAPKLSDDRAETFTAVPEEFAVPVTTYDWCIVGVKSLLDRDIKVGDTPDAGPWFAYSQEEGTVCDFVVLNGQGDGSPIRYAQVNKGSAGRFD